MNHNTPPRDPHVNFDVGHVGVSRPSSRRTPSNQTSPPSSYPQPTMSRTMSRSSASSHRSSTSDHMKSQWHPKQSIAISSVEGKEGKGNVVGSRGLSGEVEKGLSSLYVKHERISAESNVKAVKERKTIGGKVVGGAVNATVFGVALGLTAYRLLSGRTAPETSTEPALEEPIAGPSRRSTTATRRQSVEPPPAYEELSPRGVPLEDDLWENDASTDIVTPVSTIRTPPKRSVGSGYRYGHRKKLSRGRIATLSTSSTASFTIHDIPSATCSSSTSPNPRSNERSHSPSPSPSTRQSVNMLERDTDSVHKQDFEDEEDDTYRNVAVRLDAMSTKLQQLILEGQKALESSSPIMPNTEGWKDEDNQLRVGAGVVDASPPRKQGTSIPSGRSPKMKHKKAESEILASRKGDRTLRSRSATLKGGSWA